MALIDKHQPVPIFDNHVRTRTWYGAHRAMEREIK